MTWNLPADNGGSPITLYELQLDSGEGWDTVYRGDSLEYQCESYCVTTEPVVPGIPSPPTLIDKPKANGQRRPTMAEPP